ncbi:MAG: hypothetical protein ACYSUI_00575 [Planctomycetota bacterium]|jgi:hypothetical protein
MTTPTTQQQFEQQQAQRELARVHEQHAAEDRSIAIGILANHTGLDRDSVSAALSDPDVRIVKVKAASAQHVAGQYYSRVAGRPDQYLLLAADEQLPQGVDVIGEALLAEVVQDGIEGRARARRLVGVSAMNPMSQAAAAQEREVLEMDERAAIAAIDGKLAEITLEELAHVELDAEQRQQVLDAFNANDPRALDDIFIAAEAMQHPGTGEHGLVYRFHRWTPDSDADLENRPGHRARTLRELAMDARDRAIAKLRYGERALQAAPQAFMSPII